MKRFMITLGVVFATGIVAAPVAFAGTGNGAPSGPHFNLNIHGVANGQGFNGSNQNDIFVPLYGSCKINLQQSFTYDFQVLQPDCVNNPSATFSLPAPCAISATTGLCTGTETIYSVWARALAKPGGSSSTTTCATDSTGTLVCSLNSYVVVRGTGQSKFSNVSNDLLFLTTCNTTTGKTVSTPIFSQNFQNYLWLYDNNGLRLLQLRFYQVPSMVPTSVSCP
ncbi:MAG: hypothetical protein KGL15_03045 [Acidobacteriota bacterium]|nr:hypothetical protein [Acidobacteriota bacterium]